MIHVADRSPIGMGVGLRRLAGGGTSSPLPEQSIRRVENHKSAKRGLCIGICTAREYHIYLFSALLVLLSRIFRLYPILIVLKFFSACIFFCGIFLVCRNSGGVILLAIYCYNNIWFTSNSLRRCVTGRFLLVSTFHPPHCIQTNLQDIEFLCCLHSD